jgi:hypothetical protein
MTIDEIFEHWDKDSVIDRNELGKESIEIPKIHNKYYRIYINEKMKLIKQESDLKQLISLRHDFYSGNIDNETLKELNWWQEWEKIGRRTILKTEIPRYLEADQVIIDRQLKIAAQREKVGLLDSIIKSLVSRGFNIKSGIEWARFQVGA